MSPEQRLWWRRLPLVLVRPQEVFAALRSTDEDDEAARQEPVLLVVLVAGMAGAVLSPAWREVLDQPDVDGLAALVLTFVVGGAEGAVRPWPIGAMRGRRGAAGGAASSARTSRPIGAP